MPLSSADVLRDILLLSRKRSLPLPPTSGAAERLLPFFFLVCPLSGRRRRKTSATLVSVRVKGRGRRREEDIKVYGKRGRGRRRQRRRRRKVCRGCLGNEECGTKRSERSLNSLRLKTCSTRNDVGRFLLYREEEAKKEKEK